MQISISHDSLCDGLQEGTLGKGGNWPDSIDSKTEGFFSGRDEWNKKQNNSHPQVLKFPNNRKRIASANNTNSSHFFFLSFFLMLFLSSFFFLNFIYLVRLAIYYCDYYPYYCYGIEQDIL